jgi:Ulp1 family protease
MFKADIKIHVLGSFFYRALEAKERDRMRKWTKGIDIFDYDFLLIPINLQYENILVN